MATRRDAAATRRARHHRQQIQDAGTAAGRFWKACSYLIAEARHAGELDQATRAVLALVGRIQQRLPLTDAPHEATRDTTRTIDRREVA